MAFILRDSIPHGTARGNTCYLCGAAQKISQASQKLPFVDTNIHIDQEGFLLICSPCVEEMANLVGMLDAVKAADVVAESEELKQELERLRIQLSLTEDVVTSVTRYNDFVAKD